MHRDKTHYADKLNPFCHNVGNYYPPPPKKKMPNWILNQASKRKIDKQEKRNSNWGPSATWITWKPQTISWFYW